MNFRDFSKIVLKSYELLNNKQPLLLSSATAFFAVFSLAPIIIIVINVLSLYFQQQEISSQLYDRLETEFGPNTADEIHTIVNNFTQQFSSRWITIAGTIFLIFVSTTLFHVIRQAINIIWNIRLLPSSKLLYTLKERGKSLLIIFSGGALFVAFFFADTAVAVLNKYLDGFLPTVDRIIVEIISTLISLLVVTLWFAMLFKYLPDAILKTKYALTGGFFTAVLFNIGRYILGLVLIADNLNVIFGASASIILLLLFIFYSSLIMYFGAAFTITYARQVASGIKPKDHAEIYELSKVSLQ